MYEQFEMAESKQSVPEPIVVDDDEEYDNFIDQGDAADANSNEQLGRYT